MQIEWYRRTGKIINFSPRFLDIVSWTDGLGLNDGRDPDVVMELATTIGCCTEDLLPNDTTLPIEKYRDKSILTKEMFDEAAKYRLGNLGLVPVTIWDSRHVTPSLDQQKYNAEINDAHISGIKKFGQTEPELMIRFESTQLSEGIENSIKEITEIGIEIIDTEKIKTRQDEVNRKYKGKLVGGIGGAPVSDLIANGLVIFTFWTLKHALTDVDDALWNKLKAAFIKILKSATKTDSENQHITIEFKNPQFIFEFPVAGSPEILDKEMNRIKQIVKDVYENDPNPRLSYKYVYDLNRQEWVPETRHAER